MLAVDKEEREGRTRSDRYSRAVFSLHAVTEVRAEDLCALSLSWTNSCAVSVSRLA